MSQQYPPNPGQPWNGGPGQDGGDGQYGQPDAWGQAPSAQTPGAGSYNQPSYGQPNYGQPGYGQPSYGQPAGSSEPSGIAGPTGDGVQYVQPYGAPASGPYGNQYPQQPGQAPYGQPQYPYGMPPARPARPVWKTVLGVFFVALAVLFTLGLLSSAVSGDGPGGSGAAYMTGYIFGQLLVVAVPALIGWLLLRRK